MVAQLIDGKALARTLRQGLQTFPAIQAA